ncbi:MAG: SpoIIE family protein phosphatase [Polyangiales bacterium]
MSDLDCKLLTQVQYECRTLAEGKRVAELIAKLCPRPNAQLPGLIALIANAIEHGNLQIDAKDKARLLQSGHWFDEVDRRASLPEYASRRVRVALERTVSEVVITIADDGAGFAFARYLSPHDAGSDGDLDHGIAIAQRTSFDAIEYRGTGSEVCVRVRRSEEDPHRTSSVPQPSTQSAEPATTSASSLRAHKRPTVLVADDEPVTRLLLFAALRETYEVIQAVNGHDALEKYQTLRPDLMLVDVQMPLLSGGELCKRVRAHEHDQHTPILLMSSQNDERFVLDGLGCGADDFIVKPLNQRVLLSKIHAQLLGKNTRDTLAYQRARLLALQRATAHEHFVAQAVLKNILGRAELNHPSIRYLMTGMTGFEGDVALVAKPPGGGLRVMVSDVVGHGLPAAFGTIPVSLLFYSTTRRNLPLDEAMKHINRELCGVLPVGLFAAGAAFDVSADGRRVQIWNGGIPDIFLRRHRSRELLRFASRNIPIGVADHDTAVVEEVSVEAGDVVFVMSDGVVETRDRSGQLFGIQRVVDCLSADHPPSTLFDALRGALSKFGQGRQDDDITLLAHTVGA